MNDKGFEHKFAPIIFSIAKSVFSISIKPDRLDLLHRALRQVEIIIAEVAERKAVDVAKKVQEATMTGFEKFAHDMTDLTERVKALEQKTCSNAHTFPLRELAHVPAEPVKAEIKEYDYTEFED